jgi:undecaprenyl pyrophosphate phosphatase UppP
MPSFLRKHSQLFWDQVGIAVSSICFVHCLATPILLLSLPWMGEYFDDPIFHVLIFLIIVPIGLYAFIRGYQHHGHRSVLILGLPGLFIVGFGAFLPHWLVPGLGREAVTVIGSLFLISAHTVNRRACRDHQH